MGVPAASQVEVIRDLLRRPRRRRRRLQAASSRNGGSGSSTASGKNGKASNFSRSAIAVPRFTGYFGAFSRTSGFILRLILYER
jgi:hypothetical protein